MTKQELLEIISRDEDSRHQFKANVTNETSLAQEFVAFSNSEGGKLIIGVYDNGEISNLTREDMGRLSNLVSNCASQQVRPPINPITENIATDNGLVMVITMPKGISKPYMDKNGVIWIKSGADKRKATSREEIQRMYQSANLIHGDETPANNLTADNLNLIAFSEFYKKQYEEDLDKEELPLSQITENLNLSKNGILNIAGAVLFAKKIEFQLPAFIVKAVTYASNDIHESNYIESQDIKGILQIIFEDSLRFIMRNLRRLQNGQNVNSIGELEIPQIVLEELLTNALIHRDYFISAPIRIFIFENRVEIISPGHLPNNLTIDNIKRGNSNMRNPILASFATRILPYRGLGNGIRRALKSYPNIEFIDDRDANLFKVTIFRP